MVACGLWTVIVSHPHQGEEERKLAGQERAEGRRPEYDRRAGDACRGATRHSRRPAGSIGARHAGGLRDDLFLGRAHVAACGMLARMGGGVRSRYYQLRAWQGTRIARCLERHTGYGSPHHVRRGCGAWDEKGYAAPADR
eukprot:scaffold2497_cov119-Isochrysis_galbana.AAC.7